MISVKISIPGLSNNISLKQFLGNDANTLNNIHFFVNDSTKVDVDYWFVLDDLQRSSEFAFVDKCNIYYLTAEVAYPIGYFDGIDKRSFFNQFSYIYTCHDIANNNVQFEPPFLPWMINSNHGPSLFSESERDIEWLSKLKNIEKKRKLSVICSSKVFTPDHLLRYKFVSRLKEYFGDDLDWFGNGVNPVATKWEAIAPYKYHIVLENQSRKDVITEKIYDSYLGLAYPIYWGAPNLGQYFPQTSFDEINVYDFHASVKKIETILESRTFELRRMELLACKELVLNKYNLFKRIGDLVSNKQVGKLKTNVTLHDQRFYRNRSISGLGKDVCYKLTNLIDSAVIKLNKLNNRK